MKVFVLTALITALTGFAGFASAQASCVGRNTAACQDARNAFAEHHGGRYPSQWYQGQQGRWLRNGTAGNDWRWRSDNGREYWRGDNGWNWREAHEAHMHHHHHD